MAYQETKPCDGEFIEVECKVEDQLFIFIEWLPELAVHLGHEWVTYMENSCR